MAKNSNTLYGLSQALDTVLNLPIVAQRAPTTHDINYEIGTIWVNQPGGAASILISVANAAANWEGIGAGNFTANPLNLNVGANANNTNINTGGNTGTVTIGTSATSTAVSIQAPIINIGTDAAQSVIGIGNQSAASALNLLVGTGNFSLDGVGASTYTIGASTTTGTIAIGGNAQTGNFTLAPSTGALTVAIANGNGVKTINLGNGTSGNTISIGNGANGGAQVINIAAGLSAANSTVNILSGNGAAGTQTANILTGTRAGAVNIASGAAANVVTIGSVTGAASLSLLAGTGNFSVTGAATTAYTIGAVTDTGLFTLAPSTDPAGQTINIGEGAGGVKTINIGAGAIGNIVTIGSLSAAATTAIRSGTGGMLLNPTAGNIQITPASTQGAGAAQTLNSRLGTVTFTGFTTASAATQAFTINNTNILTTSSILLTITNLNASTNGAEMTILGTTQAAGSIIVNTKNNGAGALGGGDNVLITFFVLD